MESRANRSISGAQILSCDMPIHIRRGVQHCPIGEMKTARSKLRTKRSSIQSIDRVDELPWNKRILRRTTRVATLGEFSRERNHPHIRSTGNEKRGDSGLSGTYLLRTPFHRDFPFSQWSSAVPGAVPGPMAACTVVRARPHDHRVLHA